MEGHVKLVYANNCKLSSSNQDDNGIHTYVNGRNCLFEPVRVQVDHAATRDELNFCRRVDIIASLARLIA